MNNAIDADEIMRGCLEGPPWPALMIDEQGVVTFVNATLRHAGTSLESAPDRSFEAMFPAYRSAPQGPLAVAEVAGGDHRASSRAGNGAATAPSAAPADRGIQVPPLRSRGKDIHIQARHFVAEHGRRLGKRITDISRDVEELLAQYHWPGNVRELENVIERAVILAEGDTLRRAQPHCRAVV